MGALKKSDQRTKSAIALSTRTSVTSRASGEARFQRARQTATKDRMGGAGRGFATAQHNAAVWFGQPGRSRGPPVRRGDGSPVRRALNFGAENPT